MAFPGFDVPRPMEKDYERVKETLKGLNISGLSCFLYGSFARGTHIVGKSDIDGVFIFSDEFITNKQTFNHLGRFFADLKSKTNISLEFSVLDNGMIRDGRFFNYGPSYQEQFISEGEWISGDSLENIVGNMNFQELVNPSENTISQKFGSMRRCYLDIFSIFDLDSDKDNFEYVRKVKGFEISLDRAARFVNQIAELQNISYQTQRAAPLSELRTNKNFSQVDFEIIDKYNYLRENLNELNKLYSQPEKILKLFEECVTFSESLLKAHCESAEKKSISY